MKEKQLADIAVKITQVIKNNLDLPAQQVIKKMLDEIPELANDIDKTCQYLLSMADSLDFKYEDVSDIIEQIQQTAKSTVGKVDWSNLWQKIATGIYYVARIVISTLPPKWRDVVLAILNAYDRLILQP